MKGDFLHVAKKLATDSIYDDAVFVGTWEGNEVYKPIFTDNKEHCVGFPEFIIGKAGHLRWTKDNKESSEILNSLQ
jgi:hypothetical protein